MVSLKYDLYYWFTVTDSECLISCFAFNTRRFEQVLFRTLTLNIRIKFQCWLKFQKGSRFRWRGDDDFSWQEHVHSMGVVSVWWSALRELEQLTRAQEIIVRELHTSKRPHATAVDSKRLHGLALRIIATIWSIRGRQEMDLSSMVER